MSLLVERPPGHQLRSDGLYRFIRRLSYLAVTIVMPSTAAALGSLLALVPAFYYGSMYFTQQRSGDKIAPSKPKERLGSRGNAETTAAFARVGDILPKIGISKRRLKQLEAILLIREQRDNGKQELAFHARPFVLCGLPLRRPPGTLLVHRRRNGRFFLHVVAHPDLGLPFGQDRLIPIWVATLALRQKSREVHFDSAAQMLDFFQLPKDGPHYRRLVDGFKRIFGATIFFGTEEQPSAASVIDWARFHFFDRLKLWFNREERRPASSAERYDNVILLSESFYREMDEHRIPVEREVIAALAHAPGVLDFYIWLVWKSWGINGTPARISLTGKAGLKDQLGVADYRLERTFRLTLCRWLRTVRALWPQCPASISTDGHSLLVSSSKSNPTLTTGLIFW